MYGFCLNPIAPDCADFSSLPTNADGNFDTENLVNSYSPPIHDLKHTSLNNRGFEF